jgi:peptidoglycan glycosyltransferase
MSRALSVVARRYPARQRRRAVVRGRSGRLGTALVVVGLVVAIMLGMGIVGAISAYGVIAASLPDPRTLDGLGFAQPTIVLARDGTTELGRFEQERRRTVSFGEIPTRVLDATTAAEDRTFWQNPGFDPGALVAAVAETASGGRERGASTITQQLVRARLLPDDVVAPGSDRYLRKVKEIIQAMRLTDAFPGEAGKQRVITAYLNEVFYGHGAYGVAAAAQIYFGVGLDELTVAQSALLAGLVKSPTTLDPYRYARADADGHLVVPAGTEPVRRRDWILQGMAATSRWTHLTAADLAAALAEPVVLAGVPPAANPGGQFTWQVRRRLQAIVGPDVDLATAGYRVITTLDWHAQRLGAKWLAASMIAPNLSRKRSTALLDDLHVSRRDRRWIGALRGKDLHNGALVAIDYRTGDVLAYLGSAGYGRSDLASARFEPKYDAAGDGVRQPGSAFKPILYAAAFDAHKLTPGSLLLDVTTRFARRARWAPRDADHLERGPVLVRKALQYSLNIPAIRALERVGSERVADTAERLGLRFAGGRAAFLQAGLAGAIGTVEVSPLDLTTAYATLANGGTRVTPRMILKVIGPDGRVVWDAPTAAGDQAVSAAAAFLVGDILAGNTDPRTNPIWAKPLALHNGPGGKRRPAAVKTGTTNDARDLGTYGWLPPQPDDGIGLTVGIWLGNSNHAEPRSRQPATSLTAAAPLWHAFVRDYTKGWPVTTFERPAGLTRTRIDAWSGGRPGPWTRATIKEWFIKGTEPGRRKAVDPDGLLYRRMCGGWRVDPVKAELGPSAWKADVADWLRRAHRGRGVLGPLESRTAVFWGERWWGGPLAGSCPAPRPPADRGRGHGNGHGKGHGGGHGHGPPGPSPTPLPTVPPVATAL